MDRIARALHIARRMAEGGRPKLDYSGGYGEERGLPFGRHKLDLSVPVTKSTDIVGSAGAAPDMYGPGRHDVTGRIGLRTRFADGGRTDDNFKIGYSPQSDFNGQESLGPYGRHSLDFSVPITNQDVIFGRGSIAPDMYGPARNDYSARIGYRHRFADGGAQRTAPFPEKPEGYEFYGPDDRPGDAPPVKDEVPNTEGMLSYDPAQEPPRKGPPAIMEPDLTQMQSGQFPEGLDPDKYVIGDGNIIYDKETNEPVQFTRRTNVLPWTKTPQGDTEWNIPKVLDIVGNMGGGWSVPVHGAETVLGVGARLPRRASTVARRPAESIADNLVQVYGDDHAAIANWLDAAKGNGVEVGHLEDIIGFLPESLRDRVINYGASRSGRPDIHPDFGADAASKAQSLADELVRVHGDDVSAIRDKLNTLLPEAQSMVFDKLPERTRYGIKTEDAYASKPRKEPITEQEFKQIPYEPPTEVPQRDYSSLDELESALRGSPHRVPSDRPQVALQPQNPRANLPINGGGPIDLDTFFSRYFAGDIKRLSNGQLDLLGREIQAHEDIGSGFLKNLENYQPEMLRALRGAIRDYRNSTGGESTNNQRIVEEFRRMMAGRTAPTAPTARAPRTAPPPPPDPGPFSGISRDFDEYFRRVLGRFTNGSLESLSNQMFAGNNTKGIYATGAGGRGITLEGRIYTPEGKYIGRIERSIYPAEKLAYHGFFEVDPGVRSTGIPAQILRSQIDFYKRLGIEQVKLSAGLESGPYAWAKYGWIPTQRSWDDLRRSIAREVRENFLQIPDPDARSAFLKIIESDNPRRIWDLADFKGKDIHGLPAGGYALLGHDWIGAPLRGGVYKKGWVGILHINDPSAMRRFDDYVKREPSKPKPQSRP